MHIEDGLFLDIVVILSAAFIGGLAARLLRLPILLGYLVVGMIIGPHALQVVGNVETVNTLAEFGVVLLLFAVGVEISFRDIRRLGKVIVFGGAAQVLVTMGLVIPVGVMVGMLPNEAILLGMAVSLSSTMVVLKTLTDRGELHSVHGRVLTGILLVQDLAFIPMIAILPAMSGGGGGFLVDLGLGIFKAAAVLTIMALLGSKVIPWVLHRITHLGSREIFILTVVVITFTTAVVTQAAGLSAALGAFVAGLLLSESDFGHRALSEVIPLRDIFSVLFFVSLGMLADPTFVLQNYGLVLVVIAMVIPVKFVLTAGLVRAFGFLPFTALIAGLGMVQIGEFSFILVGAAAALGIVSPDFLTLIVISAVLTMAVTPWIMSNGSRAVGGLSRHVRFLQPYRIRDARAEARWPQLRNHVVLCGLGRVGSLVAHALGDHHIPYMAIDLDPHVVAQWRDRGQYVIHGSSGSETVLDIARVKYARLMVVAIGDSITSSTTVQHGRRMNPKLDIVARVHWREEGERLQRLGVDEVVWTQMEAGLEILRHSLHRYHADPTEVDQLVTQLRDHLGFGTPSELEDILPAEGLGEAPKSLGKPVPRADLDSQVAD